MCVCVCVYIYVYISGGSATTHSVQVYGKHIHTEQKNKDVSLTLPNDLDSCLDP